MLSDAERSAVVESVREALRSLEAAERALDAEGLIAHFAEGPEFHIHNDGQLLTYGAMTAAVRSTFPTFRSIAGGFLDVRILVLAADAALVTARFQEAGR